MHAELQDIYGLESLILIGNPIVNQNPQLARIEHNDTAVGEALVAYFSGQGGAGFGGSGSFSTAQLQPGAGAAAYATASAA